MAWARQSPKSKLWGGVYRVESTAKPTYLPMVHRTKTAAQREASEAEGIARRRPGYNPHGPRTLWGAWADEWWPEHARRLEASTRQSCESSLSRHVRSRWESVPLGSITEHAVQVWVNGLLRDLAPSSIRQPYRLLSGSLMAAVRAKLIESNPCDEVKLPTVPPAQDRFLADDEIAGLRAHLDGPWLVLFDLLLDTGMRIGEAAGLHWHRVDLDRQTVLVAETWSRAGGHVKAYPKGRKMRLLPIPAGLAGSLREWRQMHPPAGSCGREHVALGPARSRAAAAACSSSLVVTGAGGAPVHAGDFAAGPWRAAVRAAEIAHTTPHALRHTYASRLLTGGAPIARVSRRLGHSSIAMTERYAVFMDDNHDEDRAILESRRTHDAARDAERRHPVAPGDTQRGRLRVV